MPPDSISTSDEVPSLDFFDYAPQPTSSVMFEYSYMDGSGVGGIIITDDDICLSTPKGPARVARSEITGWNATVSDEQLDLIVVDDSHHTGTLKAAIRPVVVTVMRRLFGPSLGETDSRG